MTRAGSPGWRSSSERTTAGLGVRGGGHLVALLRVGHRVGHALGVGERHPHLDALGGRDPALLLDVAPRGVVALGADQGEDVALAAVLAHEGGGEAEAPSGLQVGRHAEHRSGQQVHLVVDDQPPVAGVEQLQVAVLALGLAGDHLVRGDRDGPDLLALAGVLADLVRGERRARDQLPLPLTTGDGVGDQDQRGGLRLRHRGRPDQRLPGPARQHDHPRAARPEALDGLALVAAQAPALLAEGDRRGPRRRRSPRGPPRASPP